MIYVLCADLSDADQKTYESLYRQMSPDRKKRADRCVRFEDKMRCVASEVLLRTVLGTGSFRTETNAWGKPHVAGKKNFHYNISHSGRYAVIAWGCTEIGVDVQCHKPGIKVEQLSRRFFTRDEQEYIGGDLARFYEVWTKKESYVKYTGMGLQLDMRSFSVLRDNPAYCYQYRMMDEEYSICLCGEEEECAIEYIDIWQLL